MKNRMQHAMVFRLACAALLFMFSSSCFAYLDPSTGSMLVTAVVGMIASIALAVKTYWYKFKNLLRRSNQKSEESGSDTSPGA